jgi:hypothetical protein
MDSKDKPSIEEMMENETFKATILKAFELEYQELLSGDKNDKKIERMNKLAKLLGIEKEVNSTIED